MGKRRYITFKVDEDIPDIANLRSQGPAREPLRVRCGRCMRFCGFCCVCTCTFFQALAPWMLSVIELGTLLLLLLLLFLPNHPPGPYSFDFHSSLEDLVLLGGLRAAAICGTYAYGSSRYRLRPYLYTSYICGCAGLVYDVVKASQYAYPVAWLPPAAMMVAFGTFSWLHILAARYTVNWYRRRGQLGLLQGPFQPPQGFRRNFSAGSLAAASSPSWLEDSTADLPPELLADPDSQFLDVDGLVVHYKEAAPAAGGAGPGVGEPHVAAGESPVPSPPAFMPADHPTKPSLDQQQQQTADSSSAGKQGRASTPNGVQQQQQQQPSVVAEISAAATAADLDAEVPAARPDVALVLIHGFGGGVFAWRHLLQPLADALGVRVVAFDRPGFGLTARPEVDDSNSSAEEQAQLAANSSSKGLRQPLLPTHQQQPASSSSSQLRPHAAANPYSIHAQAHLTLRFCELLGLRRVLLVGHADGCLVAVHAAAAACRRSHPTWHAHHHHQHQPHSQQQLRYAAAAATSSGKAVQQSLTDMRLDSQGSVDFSWMGSLGKDPTPRMIARTQALLQHQQQAAAGDGGSHPGQQQQQQNVQESGPPDSPFGTYALPADASLQDAQLLHRVLEGVKESEQAEGGGSTASSLSFQSMLQSAARNSSRQNLTDAGSESGYTSATPSEAGFRTPGPSDGGGSGSAGGGAGAAAGPATISMDADGSYLVGGGVLPAEAGSGNTHTNDDDQTQSPSLQQSPHPPQLDRSGSLVLKPPLPHPPFSSAGSRSSSGRGAGASRPQPSISPGSQRRSPGSNSSSGDGGGGGSGGSSGAGGDHAAVDIKVAGLVLLHPNLSGHQVPAFTRLLAASSLGRSMLRPLLRSEVGVVTNRRAWHNPDLITREVLQLYKRPLRVQGWDAALLATSRAAGSLSQKQVVAQFTAVRNIPALLVTGEHDRIATPGKVAGVASLLSRAQRAVVTACGHLSHEEAPQQLLELLVPFCRQHLSSNSLAAAAVGS